VPLVPQGRAQGALGNSAWLAGYILILAVDIASMPSPDHAEAARLLQDGLRKCATFTPTKLNAEQQEAIRSIIEGSHLTFRYILMTALLGKVVEPRIHMRSIQAGANLKGAYDARSLCHKVWVPFEREHLESRLGGSNEPFLNKPARFPAIEKTNAVRAGRERQLLHLMYDLLESLNKSTATRQREAFLFALSLVTQRGGRATPVIPLAPILLAAPVLAEFLAGQRVGRND